MTEAARPAVRAAHGGTLGSRVRRHVKALLGLAAHLTGVARWHWRDKAVIVVFHRVDDRHAGDPLTCTRAEFRAFCRYFARYFHVVPLTELLARLARGEDVGRHLAITFDDGYRDNWTVAAQELRALELPACFFVATDFIESNAVPWWDAELGVTPEWMSWDEVRALADAGFELGPHTRTHVDLGVVDVETARGEIVQSRARLEREIGRPARVFAFPYGRPTQMSEANREVVRQAGLVCCLSAYGGFVRPGDDPYQLRRHPISPWYLSPYQFAFEAMRREEDSERFVESAAGTAGVGNTGTARAADAVAATR